jgi:CRP-like cAMP-binding protein
VSIDSAGSRALRRVLERAGTVPEEDWPEFAALFRSQRLEKNTTWLRVGQPAEHLGFVVSGLFRLYYTRADGKELNKSFIAEGDFLASIHSMLEGAPSRLAIESLEEAQILVAPYREVTAFYERSMYWQRLGRLMAERLVVKKLEREASFLLDSAAERYACFLREHADIEPRVPDHQIARYLGITPEALSRLRRARGARPAPQDHSRSSQRPPRR